MSKKNRLINSEAKIKSYLKKLKKETYWIEEFYYVGSRGNGTAREDSDWDILVKTKFPVKNFRAKYGKPDGYNIDFSTTHKPKFLKPIDL